jgi:hypothetical protein
MSHEQQRAEVVAMYPGSSWKRRVMKMSDAQVYAIWIKNRQRQEQKQKLKEETKEDPPDDNIPF